jgi:D-inositol-3-phosphate glycosyltransferase
MRIALVHRDLHALTRGGICTLYRALADRLRDAGHDITLITQHTPHPLAYQRGIRVVTLPRTEDLPAHRGRVEAALESLSPDVVESSSWEAETLHYAQRPAAARAAVVVRGDLSAATMRAGRALIDTEQALLELADVTVAVSRFAAGDLAASYRIPRPAVIPNGVDVERFHPGPVTPPTSGQQLTLTATGRAASRAALPGLGPVPPWAPTGGRRRVVWVGKTTPMKGWDHLERLARQLHDVAHITVLLGHAPPLAPITVTGTEDNLTILQDLADADLPSFYRAAEFLLCTSRWEGFGLAAVEAMSCGTPVLLPAGLGTAPELLAAGGGHTYRSTADLRSVLAAEPSGPVRLPEAFNWDTNITATLAVYEALHAARAARCAS